jgi:hypothetical protein
MQAEAGRATYAPGESNVVGYDLGEAGRESYQNPQVGLQARRRKDRLNSKTYAFFPEEEKVVRFWFRSEDLRVV